MEIDDFEWDDAKAASNLVKHRVSFEDATFAFDDPEGVDLVDETQHYDEVRYKLLATDGQRLLAVVYTERPPRLRIISAREADPHEQAHYDQRRSPGRP